jgi:hypothetical protein
MNKALKIGLITTAIAIPTYFSIRYYLRNRDYKEAEERYKEEGTEKKLLIMQILIKQGKQITEQNMNPYYRFTVNELIDKLNEGVEM